MTTKRHSIHLYCIVYGYMPFITLLRTDSFYGERQKVKVESEISLSGRTPSLSFLEQCLQISTTLVISRHKFDEKRES